MCKIHLLLTPKKDIRSDINIWLNIRPFKKAPMKLNEAEQPLGTELEQNCIRYKNKDTERKI